MWYGTRRERWTPFPMTTWQLSLVWAVFSLSDPELLLFLCLDGPWLPCISTVPFLPNHKPFGVRGIGPGFLLSTVGPWLLPVRSVEALLGSDPRSRVVLSDKLRTSPGQDPEQVTEHL